MATIKETLRARAQAESQGAKPEMPEWQREAEKALAGSKRIQRQTAVTLAESIAKTGYPKNLTFCGCYIQIRDEHDLAAFWRTVYANLSKKEYEELAKPDHAPITERQVAEALFRSCGRIDVAQQLVDNGITEGAVEFESDGAYYVLAAGMVIALDGHVVADVSDLSTPFGPEEWVEVANRIRAERDSSYDESYDESYDGDPED